MVNGREKRRAAIVFKKRSDVMCEDDGANDERSARVNFNVIPYSSNRLPVYRHYGGMAKEIYPLRRPGVLKRTARSETEGIRNVRANLFWR